MNWLPLLKVASFHHFAGWHDRKEQEENKDSGRYKERGYDADPIPTAKGRVISTVYVIEDSHHGKRNNESEESPLDPVIPQRQTDRDQANKPDQVPGKEPERYH